MIEEAAYLLGLGIFGPPYTINFVLHTPTQGGQRGTPRNLLDMVQRLDELPVARNDLRVNVTSMGRTQLPITTIALAMGLNVRVGMEDNVMYRRGEPLENNAQLVERAVRTARELDREPATPEEARAAPGPRGAASGGWAAGRGARRGSWTGSRRHLRRPARPSGCAVGSRGGCRPAPKAAPKGECPSPRRRRADEVRVRGINHAALLVSDVDASR